MTRSQTELRFWHTIQLMVIHTEASSKLDTKCKYTVFQKKHPLILLAIRYRF